jgi:hypothetical protein
MADWSTISALGTAVGTLALAAATFVSVRSSNRSARLAERSLLVGIRPLLLSSRMEDPPEKVAFQDEHWIRVPGGHGYAEAETEVIYLAIALRNVGQGLAVLDSWAVRTFDEALDRPRLSNFRRLTRDLYIAPTDRGFWQGTFRDPSEPEFAVVTKFISGRESFIVDLLYGDGEGGQRMVTRFAMRPARDQGWIASVVRHWNLDRAAPR